MNIGFVGLGAMGFPMATRIARPVLELMGKRLFEIGAPGAGHAMKALNNYVSAAAFQATSVALLIGKRFGIDPTQLIDILNVSTGQNFHSELSMKDHVIAGRHAAGFLLALAAKDVRIAAGLAAALKIDAPMLKLSAAQMSAASNWAPRPTSRRPSRPWGRGPTKPLRDVLPALRKGANYRLGGGGKSVGGVMSKRCFPVTGSTDRSTSTQKFTSYAVCPGWRVYSRVRLSGAVSTSGAVVTISKDSVSLSCSEMRSVILTFLPTGMLP